MAPPTEEGDIVAFELWRLPVNFFSLEQSAQYEAIAKVTKKPEKITKPRAPCPMTFGDEALAVLYFMLVLGVPLLIPVVTCGMLATRPALLRWWLPTLGFLAFHPIPKYRPWYRRNRIGVILAKYFTITLLMDRNDPNCQRAGTPAVEENPVGTPVVTLACPHGVLNWGAITWVFFSRWIVGLEQYTAGANVITRVPGLRYAAASLWAIPADRGSLKRSLQEEPRILDKKGQRFSTAVPRRGGKVGIVPDGIAGIFKSTPGKDVLFLGKKRGLMRICLEEGATIFGGWFNGTSEMFYIVTDPFGIMEAISRKLKVSIFLFFGRWGSPVPRRVAVTMCARVVQCSKSAAPSEQEVESLHDEVYGGLSRRFDAMKHYCGYPDRTLEIQ
mmetsp:Transcript_23087/g.65049  ORF Transcript_23087/g.65049 Transcript_23087/m.65049 type:complete len:386 (-) Transcript_23087:58-1215(-)